MSLPLYVEPSPQISTPCSAIALHEHRPGDGAAERRRVEVACGRRSGCGTRRTAARRAPRARARRGSRRAPRPRRRTACAFSGTARDVGLVVLAEVGGERVRDRAALAHPRERAAGVEAARERDADALADGERAEDDAAPFGVTGAHASPSRWWPELLRRARRRVMPSRTATKTVFSPAIVPATSCERRLVDRVGERRPRSRAASWITSSWPVGFIPLTQRRSADGELRRAGRGRRRRAARRRAGRCRSAPSRARAARCRARRSPARRRSPRSRSASASSACVESCCCSTSRRIAPCRS